MDALCEQRRCVRDLRSVICETARSPSNSVVCAVPRDRSSRSFGFAVNCGFIQNEMRAFVVNIAPNFLLDFADGNYNIVRPEQGRLT
jgi:hypothetical protein